MVTISIISSLFYYLIVKLHSMNLLKYFITPRWQLRHFGLFFGKQFFKRVICQNEITQNTHRMFKQYYFQCFNLGLQRRYLSTDDEYFFRRCDENEKDIMRRKYLDILKKSGFRELCITYADLCKSENVDVQCWSFIPAFMEIYDRQNWHCIFMQTTMTRTSTTITLSSTLTIRLILKTNITADCANKLYDDIAFYFLCRL